jgi:hypothetical protein
MNNEKEPPGSAVKFETINRQYDKDDRLISERVTITTDTQIDHPQPERHTGFYL